MNRTLRHAFLLAFAISVSAAPVFAEKKAKVESAAFVTVNGKAIPKIRADAMIAIQINQGRPDSPEMRLGVKDALIRGEVLTQESVKKGFDKKPEVQGQLDLARQDVLIGAYLRDYVGNHPITEDQIKREYEDIKARLGNKEYKARHILVEKEDDAKAIIAKLKKGEKFDDLAKESKDPGSKDRGGDLGWANPATPFDPPFLAAMIKLEKGKITETPVKSRFGWHVIQLDDTRDLKLPPMDQVKDQISQQLQQRMVQKHIEELRSKAKVE